MTAWIEGAARQVPRATAADRRHLLACRAGRVALALFRAGLVLLMLDASLRLSVAEVTR